MGSNLLAIDWDYFFPNPIEGGHTTRQDYLLYDWGHRESRFFIDVLWPTRALGFVGNGLPLPTVNDGWRTFLDRFQFSDDVTSYVSESNMEAGTLTSKWGTPFESVWLYDAHHDAGYSHTSLEAFQAHGTFSCEDWMLVHAQDGSDLHVRFPQWKQNCIDEEPSVKDLKIDMAQDDLSTPPVVFDTVHLCRSGAWVPSWEDEKFFEFQGMLPGSLEEIGDYELVVREFDMDEVNTLWADRETAMSVLAAHAATETPDGV